MGYVARSLTAPTVKNDVAEVIGVNLFPAATRLSGVKTIYKSSMDFTDIDHCLMDGSVHSESGSNQKILYFKIGGVTKVTITAAGESWARASNNDAYVDTSAITGDQDIEIELDDSTSSDAEVKFITMVFCRA